MKIPWHKSRWSQRNNTLKICHKHDKCTKMIPKKQYFDTNANSVNFQAYMYNVLSVTVLLIFLPIWTSNHQYRWTHKMITSSRKNMQMRSHKNTSNLPWRNPRREKTPATIFFILQIICKIKITKPPWTMLFNELV